MKKEKITLYKIKQVYKDFEDFARFCFCNGTIAIDFVTPHTRMTYFELGDYWTLVESDNDRVDRIAYYTERPMEWESMLHNPKNVAKKTAI